MTFLRPAALLALSMVMFSCGSESKGAAAQTTPDGGTHAGGSAGSGGGAGDGGSGGVSGSSGDAGGPDYSEDECQIRYCAWGCIEGVCLDPMAISAGPDGGCALRSGGGDVLCWGGYDRDHRDDPLMVSVNINGGIALSPDADPTSGCAVLSGGEVHCWNTGANAVRIDGIEGASFVTGYRVRGCAVHGSNAGVSCWGYERLDRLDEAPRVIDGVAGAISVVQGDFHRCALLESGEVSCWGMNTHGQLGLDPLSSEPERWTAATVPGIENAIGLATGGDFTCAALTSGRVECWGTNGYGELGRGHHTSEDYFEPAPVVGVSGASDVVANQHGACARLADGGWTCWGYSEHGVLNATAVGYADDATPLEFAAEFKQMALATDHACGLEESGEVLCWGVNDAGETGVVPGVIFVDVPGITNAVQVESSGVRTCALLDDGDVVCWGENWDGILGHDGEGSALPRKIEGLGPAVHISTGARHTCVALRSGEVACWGENGSSAFGDGTNESSITPVTTLGAAGVTQVSAGRDHACAIRTDEQPICWGIGEKAGRGYNSSIPLREAGPVLGPLSPAGSIASGDDFSCAVQSTDGQVFCWGKNDSHQINGEERATYAAPVALEGLVGAEQVTSGARHACALMRDGSVRCWGENVDNQVDARGGPVGGVPPTPIVLQGSVVTLNAGEVHTCAVDSEGRVQCWGRIFSSKLGKLEVNLYPIVVPGVYDAVDVAAGAEHSCAVLASGRIRCWGDPRYGVMGGFGEPTIVPPP
jgi:alpha-tubulin suppressor-like RCC1 family protein